MLKCIVAYHKIDSYKLNQQFISILLRSDGKIASIYVVFYYYFKMSFLKKVKKVS